MKVTILIIYLLLVFADAIRHCRPENRVLNFFKLKSCHRSTLPVIYWTNVDKVEDCVTITREKNGLAFNFSPEEGRTLSNGFVITCQVLGCPEIAQSSTLIEDFGFDYYSAYGNLIATENATCIKNIGLFSGFSQKQNYTSSIDFCQSMGGDLADISSEIRTKYLSNIVNDTLDDWYKVAYVGLDDIEQEGYFITSFNLPLRCLHFRSWAPGHPISDTKRHDCVVLDTKKMWRVVDCNRKLPVLCEFFPEKPESNDPCKYITNKNKKSKCVKRQEALEEMLKNMTRIEKCAILNVEVPKIIENTTQIVNQSEIDQNS